MTIDELTQYITLMREMGVYELNANGVAIKIDLKYNTRIPQAPLSGATEPNPENEPLEPSPVFDLVFPDTVK